MYHFRSLKKDGLDTKNHSINMFKTRVESFRTNEGLQTGLSLKQATTKK